MTAQDSVTAFCSIRWVNNWEQREKKEESVIYVKVVNRCFIQNWDTAISD